MRFRHLIVGLGSVLLLAGCIQVDYRVAVQDDGSTEFDVDSVIDMLDLVDAFSLSQDAVASSGGIEGMCTGLNPEIDGADVESSFEGSACEVDFSTGLGPGTLQSAEFERITSLEGAIVEQQGDEWILDVPLGPYIDLSEALTETAMSNARATVVVELPGVAIDGEHNADRVSGGEFTWDLRGDRLPDRLIARTEPGVPGGERSRIWLYLAIAFWVAVAACGAWWYREREARS